MRILCPVQIVYHTQGIVWGLRKLGCEVMVLDGFPVARAELCAAIERFRPDLLFTFGWWMDHIRLEDLSWIRERYHLPHVYWASDDPTHHATISLPMAHLADFVYTTTEEMLPVYSSLGKKTAYLQFACNPELHRRISSTGFPPHDLVVVAWNYSHFDFMRTTYRTRCMETILTPLVKAGFDLRAYGDGWGDRSRPFHLPAASAGPAVPYDALAGIYASAKIVLGLQTECHWATQTSCRPFEVLGCRAFHLAPATRAMKTLFHPGRDLVVTHTAAETVELAHYYLGHDAERERIAAAGQLEVYRHHTYQHRARQFLGQIAEAL